MLAHGFGPLVVLVVVLVVVSGVVGGARVGRVGVDVVVRRAVFVVRCVSVLVACRVRGLLCCCRCRGCSCCWSWFVECGVWSVVWSVVWCRGGAQHERERSAEHEREHKSEKHRMNLSGS